MDEKQIRDEQENVAGETPGEDAEGHLFRGKFREEGGPDTKQDSESDDPDVEGHRWHA